MNNSKKLFPSDFPTGCPPLPFEDFSLTFYYFINENVDDPENFLTYADTGKNVNKNEKKECQSYGLSMLGTLKAAKIYSKLPTLRNKKLAQGVLSSNEGVVKNTPNVKTADHYTFWQYEDVDLSQFFALVEKS